MLTGLGLVPFLALLTRETEDSDFRACTKDQDCFFVRFPSLVRSVILANYEVPKSVVQVKGLGSSD